MDRLPPADEEFQALPWYPILRQAVARQLLEMEEWMRQELRYLEELCTCECAECRERRAALAGRDARPVELAAWRERRA
jgi:hypothetical protein